MPAEIDADSLGTLVDLFETSTARFADRPALTCFGSSMTYAALGSASRAVAAWLAAQGLAKGDRVAIMMPNVPAYAVAIFGVLVAGGTVVNSTRSTRRASCRRSSTIPAPASCSCSRTSPTPSPRRCPGSPSTAWCSPVRATASGSRAG
jgi:acyl-CoA synthetase (AMP-forming)/AMP-acid ligase II